MGYIKEPENIDLIVAPSILTEATKKNIEQAIAQYHKTGKKPVSVSFASQARKSKGRELLSEDAL